MVRSSHTAPDGAEPNWRGNGYKHTAPDGAKEKMFAYLEPMIF